MLVFFFIVLIILGSLIVLLAATTAQLQIINFEIKDNKKNDGEIKLILKFLKLIPYLEINLLDSKFIKKRITLKSIEKTIKIAKLKLYKDKITRFLEITKVEELYLKINYNEFYYSNSFNNFVHCFCKKYD